MINANNKYKNKYRVDRSRFTVVCTQNSLTLVLLFIDHRVIYLYFNSKPAFAHPVHVNVDVNMHIHSKSLVEHFKVRAHNSKSQVLISTLSLT